MYTIYMRIYLHMLYTQSQSYAICFTISSERVRRLKRTSTTNAVA